MAYSSSTVISSSLRKEVYSPEAFVPHAALLRQAFAHCGKFPTAASRRSLGRVSVPVWLIILSDQLAIFGLVSLYLTNYLMARGLIHQWQPKPPFPILSAEKIDVCGISTSFEVLSPSEGQIIHALLTRSPLSLTEVRSRSTCMC